MDSFEAVSGGTPAIELSGLSRSFGRTEVLGEVNLEVAPGRFLVLRGGNGTGKTTLLRLIATRLQPSGGSGRVFGFDLKRQAHEVRRRTALVSVLGAAYPMLTARENLELSATLYGVKADVPHMLDRVGLSAAADRLTRGFSSGMKKRLALARLLLPGSALWLLDEPYSTLDDGGRQLVDELVTEAVERGVTVLMASHEDLRPGAPVPDAELLVADGRLQRSAPAGAAP